MRLVLISAAVLLAFPAQAADAEKGKGSFGKCAVCHAVGPDAKNKIGPQLNGIVGRAIGSGADFNYSQAMKDYAAANGTWTEALLDQYIADPKGTIPGNKMAFMGVKKPEERANIIEYLKTVQ